ncbi:MAG: AMP-binding protein [Firmicutes bacterium]|nr:AMP-binding protein [Bacillota bacterium]
MAQDIVHERVLHTLLERSAAKYGSRTYLYYEEQKYSYEEFNRQANRVASALQKLGVSKGDKVAVVMENCPEAVFIMFGLSKLGAVEVPINIYHKGDIMTYMIDHSDSRVLLMHAHFIDRLATVLTQTPKVETVVVLEDDEEDARSSGVTMAGVKEEIASLGKQVLEWSGFIDNDGLYQPAEVIFSDPILILYTSGTTGLSKGVLLPQNLLYSVPERFSDWVLEGQLNENDCIYNPMPLFHAHAWHAGVNLALLKGASTVLKKRFSATSNWEDIKRFHCTYTTGSGVINSILCLAEPKPDDGDNPLKAVLGGPSSDELCREFEPRFGAKLREFYGSTELAAPTMNTLSVFKAGSCGPKHPDYDIKIVDEAGVELGVNMPGEILVRPKKPYTMMLEYYKMPDKTVEAWRDVWFHTGDCGYFDEEGFLLFSDRKKDSLRRRGENISSFEVERVINSHPAVMESAIIGVPSVFGDDEVMLCLALKQGRSIVPEDLIAFCEERMAYFMVPRYIRFMDELPKNVMLRVEKFKLRDEGITPDTWDREQAGYKLAR